MLQKLAGVERSGGTLRVRLKDSGEFDPYVYEQIKADETCLPLMQETKGSLRYESAALTSLAYFLEHYRFAREEAYRFIIQLLEQLLKANRVKPVLLDVRYVFLPPQGAFFRFVALPIKAEHWHLQKRECLEFVKYLAVHMPTAEAYEIIGFLIRVTKGAEFSLPAVLQGLHTLRPLYEKKQSFLERLRRKHQEDGFHARVKVLEEPYREYETAQDPAKEPAYAATTLLQAPAQQAFLQDDSASYPLPGQEVIVGRGEECEIRIDSDQVSRHHVRLRQDNGRWYVRDLRSSNGSWVNGKRLQREMRLREGTELRIADHVLVFHDAKDR